MNKKNMNKKGFTLIELLAVIVILAIIALIATPIILNMINDARKSASVDSAYGYIEAVEYNNSMNMLDSKKYPKIEDGENIDIKTIVDKVKLKGTRPSSGTITVKKGLITQASLCINNYNIEYDGKEAKVNGTCGGSLGGNPVGPIEPILPVYACNKIYPGKVYSESETTIEGSTYKTNDGLYEFTVSDDEATISKYKGTETSVILPNSVAGKPITNIELSAFSNANISKITVSPNLKYFGNNSPVFPNVTVDVDFGYAENLETIFFPGFDSNITTEINLSCSPKLNKLDLGSRKVNTLIIGENNMESFTLTNQNVKELVIHDNSTITSIKGKISGNLEKLSIYNLSKLTSISDFSNNKISDLLLYNLNSLEELSSGVFSGNNISSFENVKLNNLKTIKEDAFLNNKFESIDFKSFPNIETLETHAFNGNSNLKNIIFTSAKKLTNIGTGVFCGDNTTSIDVLDFSNMTNDFASNSGKTVVCDNIEVKQVEFTNFNDSAFVNEFTSNAKKVNNIMIDNVPFTKITFNYISVNGNISIKNCQNLETIENYIPVEKMIINNLPNLNLIDNYNGGFKELSKGNVDMSKVSIPKAPISNIVD